jgi:hypothetical protein
VRLLEHRAAREQSLRLLRRQIEDLKRTLTRQEELERRYQQEGFSLTWFGVSIGIITVMTAALVMGLPMVVPLFDFEGSAGMTVAIPVWFWAAC